MSKKKARTGSGNGPMIALVVGVLALLGLFGYAVSQSLGPTYKRGVNKPAGDCVASPVATDLPGVERVPCKSNKHVADGQKVVYETDPPLSGEHHGSSVPPGFYEQQAPAELLVHSLEHGNVVIYYDKEKLTEKQLNELKALSKRYPGAWDGVVVVPRTDPKHPIILTAWEHVLRLSTFERKRIDSFVDMFRGRGPEAPVR